MYSKAVKQAVAVQVANMLINDVVEENGIEPFVGWCADGEVYEDSLNEEEIMQAMKLTKEISGYVDEISNKLDIFSK